MGIYEQIHDFAVRYHDLYESPQTVGHEVEDAFADECLALGFEMDCGHRFSEEVSSRAFSDADELAKVIEDITDVSLLGSGIFSYWRYVTHWTMGGEDANLLSDNNRKWFVLAFARLAELTDRRQERPTFFEGTLQKFRLVSNDIFYGYSLDPDIEVEQRLSISAGGQVWLTRYCYGEFGNRPKLFSKEKLPIGAESLKVLMDAVAREFQGRDMILATDVGIWELTLTNTENRVFQIQGSLFQNSFPELSDLIREKLGRDDLLLFDGNPDRVESIAVTYDRHMEIKIGKPVNPEHPYAVWDYHETLSIDRKSETVDHYRQIFAECDARNTYHIAGGVSNFLDEMDVDAFSEIEGNPPDVYTDPHREDCYKIVIVTRHGGAREISGSFDKKGLPTDWPEFIQDLSDFLEFYGIGDLFDPDAYGKVRRRIRDLIFCNVVFEDGGRSYCYIADADNLERDDLVIVPVGTDNHESVARIESIEYHPKEEAPYPLDKIKRILRKYDEGKDKELLEKEE